MHKVFEQVQKSLSIQVLHIADATISALKQHGIKRVGLLGTKYTMTQDFYKQRILEADIDVLLPDNRAIQLVNDVIFNELVLGKIMMDSKSQYLKIISDLVKQGAQGIILGCTEIVLLINQEDVAVPVFDTTLIHAKQAVEEELYK